MPPRQLKYEQIKDYLRQETLKVSNGMRLPTVRDMVSRFRVSMVTVNRALQDLEHEGVIVRQHGRGLIPTRLCREELAIKSESESRQTSHKKHQSILTISTDYPSHLLWEKTYTVEQYAKQNKLTPVNYKAQLNTSVDDIVAIAKQQKNCAGLILLVAFIKTSIIDLDHFAELPFPVINVDSGYINPDPLPANYYELAPDHYESGQLAANYLLQRGHTKIGYIRNEPACDMYVQHLKGFTQAMRQAGVDFKSRCVFSASLRFWENSSTAARELIAANIDNIRKQKLTALYFTSTSGAFATIPLLRKAGFRIPEDISLLGEGDEPYFLYAQPALTVIRPDYTALCARAVEICAGKQCEQRFYTNHHIYERESVVNTNSPSK